MRSKSKPDKRFQNINRATVVECKLLKLVRKVARHNPCNAKNRNAGNLESVLIRFTPKILHDSRQNAFP